MAKNNDIDKSAIKADEPYYKGQRIFYKEEEAQVIEVKPVFTISIQGRSHLICGNIFDDVRPNLLFCAKSQHI